MIDHIVTGILTSAGVYLAIGVICAVALHLRGLAAIDPGTRASGVLFRILVTPGLITFWPLALRRWKQASRSEDTAGGLERPLSQHTLRQWHGMATTALLVLCPAIVLVALFARASSGKIHGAPSEILFSPELYTVEARLGTYFPSIPAKVLLVRSTTRDYGLVFQFPSDASMAPVALYWSADGEQPDKLVPPDAIFLGMVFADEELWVDLPTRQMRHSGYWLSYSFLDEQTEYVPSFGTKMRRER